MENLAPIALFIFNRPLHTRRTLEALQENNLFIDSPLYIFCDGPRNEAETDLVQKTIATAQAINHPKKYLIQSESNKGLFTSITEGVTKICSEHGRVIVLEDDLIVSKFFIEYMNAALNKYKNNPRVLQISGHSFPIPTQINDDAYFLNMPTSWGWATWQRAWRQIKFNDSTLANKHLSSRHSKKMLDVKNSYPFSRMLHNNIAGKNNSWAIWMHVHAIEHNLLVLFPKTSLVSNRGFDGTGVHCKAEKSQVIDILNNKATVLPIKIEENAQIKENLILHLKISRPILKRFLEIIYKIII